MKNPNNLLHAMFYGAATVSVSKKNQLLSFLFGYLPDKFKKGVRSYSYFEKCFVRTPMPSYQTFASVPFDVKDWIKEKVML
jgi:hypothetical protein